MSSLTPNYQFVLPGVGDPADEDLWGDQNNANWSSLDTLLFAKAPLASPVFTGTPKAPTPAAGDSSTNIATTAFLPKHAAFAATRVAQQSINNNTITKLQFNSERFDTLGNYDPTTNYRFTAPIDGIYTFYIGVSAEVTTGNQTLYLYKNGAAYTLRTVSNPVNVNTNIQIEITARMSLVATDYIEAVINQDSGGARNFTLNEFSGNYTTQA